MSISFSGLASGLDTSGWVEALVSAKQTKITTLQKELTAIQTKKKTLTDARSTFNSFRTALEKLTDTKFGGSFNLFGKNSAKSSDESLFTATATSSALRQTYNISVQRLATCTKATSRESASNVADENTSLKSLGITEGRFSVYVNGVRSAIDIGENETIGSLQAKLNDTESINPIGINLSVDADGKLNFTAADSRDTIDIGSTTDTTNLASLVGLNKQDDGSYKSTISLYKATLTSKLTDDNSGFNGKIGKGTFKIGNAEFTITENTTLGDIISQINNSEDAMATAYWDDTTGKLILTSTKEGQHYINIEAGTVDAQDLAAGARSFTDIMQFTNGDEMFLDAQEIGLRAEFTINGTTMHSDSNVVTPDLTRIEGVTLTLLKTSEPDQTNETLTISQDSTELLNAVKGFVSAYNDTIAKIEEVTASGADFARETTLTSVKTTLRNYANSKNSNGGAYGLLSQIGISTAKADGSNISTTDTAKLEFDESAFLQALEEDPTSVEKLLAGENSIIAQMENTIEMTLKASVGFFDIKQTTFNSDINKMETKIKRQQTKVSAYKTQLENKFNNMEKIIAQMQQNYSKFMS